MTDYAYGEQSPTEGETPVPWSVVVDINNVAVSASGNYGHLTLALPGGRAYPDVIDTGSIAYQTITLTTNVYSTGNGTIIYQYRYSNTSFTQLADSPTWTTYTVPVSDTFRYIQIRAYVVLDVAAIGDSFGNDTDEWPDQLESSNIHINLITNACIAGNQLYQMDARFATDVIAYNPKWVVIQGGVNDIVHDRTDLQMRVNVVSMVTQARKANANVALINIGPWEGNGSWTSEYQAVTESHNAWRASYASANGFPLADIYVGLAGEGTPTKIDPALSLGDKLHPNEAGSIVIASLIKIP